MLTKFATRAKIRIFEKSHVITKLRTLSPFPLQYNDILVFEKYR